MQTQRYSFADNIISILGTPITGFDDGDDVVKLTPNAPLSDVTVGANGDVVFSDGADESYKVELALLQTAPINAFLWSIVRNQRLPGVPQIALTLSIVDMYSRTRFTGTGGRIVEAPETTLGKKAKNRVWKFHFSRGTPSEVAGAALV